MSPPRHLSLLQLTPLAHNDSVEDALGPTDGRGTKKLFYRQVGLICLWEPKLDYNTTALLSSDPEYQW